MCRYFGSISRENVFEYWVDWSIGVDNVLGYWADWSIGRGNVSGYWVKKMNLWVKRVRENEVLY